MRSIMIKILFFLFVISLSLFVAFGSLRITKQNTSPNEYAISLPDFKSLAQALEAYGKGEMVLSIPDNKDKLVFSGAEKVNALSEDQWLFVRQSATWANSNSAIVDKIITSLKDAGLLSKTGTFSKPDVLINGTTYKIKVDTGTCTSCSGISSASYTSTKTFKNRFKMWRASDNKEALELLFDDANTISSNGVLLNYHIAVLSPQVSNNENLVVESYIYGQTPSRKQSYTWSKPFWIAPSAQAATTSDSGRVVLEEMSFGLVGGGVVSGLGARIVARTVSQTINPCGTGPFYYSLSYMQKTDSNFETTALEGFAVNNMPVTSTLCGYDIVKFGIFNGGGFVQDKLEATAVPAGYPTPSGTSYDVQSEFNKIGTVGSRAGSYDDLSQTAIDTYAPAFRTANDFP